MATINEQIDTLQRQVRELYSRINALSSTTEGRIPAPRTTFGFLSGRENAHPMPLGSDMSFLGGTIFWNDAEVYHPNEPMSAGEVPKRGYHKHTHNRFSGGALISGGIEIVEYDLEHMSDWERFNNISCQQFAGLTDNDIAEVENSQGQSVRKIGLLDVVFNPDTRTWGTVTYGIDVEKTIFVKRRRESLKDEYGNEIEGSRAGDVEKDENGTPMQSPLYVTFEDGTQDIPRSSIIWDKNGKCFRFLATYSIAPEDIPEEEEEG